ncbi:MAG TPA: 3-hydroxybutyrate oligomer hydrolase family protein, partial [Burkholderiales bacterium]|nr:3-hydroxybutyrate oligomer hydrolase family protein [Burkholderiales bacterium]
MKLRSLAFIGLCAAFGPTLADELKVGNAGTPNEKPRFVGAIPSACYDGASNDLLTAGLGTTGLAAPAPAFANPLAPTPLELRRNAIHVNYRAVLDITAAGGYGRLYGPNIDNNGGDTLGEGKIAGCEYLAFADDGSARQNVTLMVQIPASFDPRNACIVTATSSGSRGIYGAIGASGEWGLKRGCAVAYTDKGSGNGLHDLVTNAVGRIDGTRAANLPAAESHFTAQLSDAERAAFNTAFPDRVAFKHAHSQQNPEADWGKHTLQAIVFAFYVLNEKHGTLGPNGRRVALDRKNTLVIASGISNGGGAALMAAEQDKHGLIDGVAVTEPQIQTAGTDGLAVMQGTRLVETIGRPLYDYFTWANLYQPCAALAVGPGAPAFLFLSSAIAANRCAGLRAKGLVTGDTTAAQAADALAKLRAYGWQAENDLLHASHYRFATNAIAVTYSNSYGRFSVADNVCGFSFANTHAITGDVIAQNFITLLPSGVLLPVPLQPGIFATGNGVPPTTGVNIVYNESFGGAKVDLLAVSPSTGTADFALDGAICHRNLVEGRDIVTGASLTGAMLEASQRVRAGIQEVLVGAELKKTPAIVVQGRADTLVPVNHASRAYYAKAQAHGNGAPNLRYVEVTNAQHFDAFLPGGPVFGGYENLYVPLHVYLVEALDLMYDHLKAGKALPPSQVVHTVPRGGAPGA